MFLNTGVNSNRSGAFKLKCTLCVCQDEANAKEELRQSIHEPIHGDLVFDIQPPQDRITPGVPSVHLDDRTFWTNRAAAYTGKPHRAVFEESLSRIYKNLYKNASQSKTMDKSEYNNHDC